MSFLLKHTMRFIVLVTKKVQFLSFALKLSSFLIDKLYYYYSIANRQTIESYKQYYDTVCIDPIVHAIALCKQKI